MIVVDTSAAVAARSAFPQVFEGVQDRFGDLVNLLGCNDQRGSEPDGGGVGVFGEDPVRHKQFTELFRGSQLGVHVKANPLPTAQARGFPPNVEPC